MRSCTRRRRLVLVVLDAVDLERLADDRADGLARVQRRVRVLEDHLHLAPQRQQRAPVRVWRCRTPSIDDRAAGRLEQPRDQARGRGLAAARLADEAERLALVDVERDAVDGLHGADLLLEDDPLADREVLDEVAHLDERLAAHGATSSAASRPATERASAGSLPSCSSRQTRRRVVGRQQAANDVLGVVRDRLELGVGRARCASRTYGQRGWNEQPPGSVISDGGRPEIGTSSSPRGRSSRGIDRSRPHVYGCSGDAKIVSFDACSTISPGVHHRDLVGDLRHDAEVVGDHHDRGVELGLQALDQVQDLRLDGHVECRRRLVGDQQLRVVGTAPSRSSRAGACRPRTRAGRSPRACAAPGCRRARASRPRGPAPAPCDTLRCDWIASTSCLPIR